MATGSRPSFGASREPIPMQLMHAAGIWIVPNEEYEGCSDDGKTKDISVQTPLGRDDSNPTTPFDFPSGAASPAPLLQPPTTTGIDRKALAQALAHSRDITTVEETLANPILELVRVRSRQTETASVRRPSHAGLAEEHGSPRLPVSQGVPPELKNFLAEIIFVLTCTAGQVIFSLTLGHVLVTQTLFREALAIPSTQTPWITGSSVLASGLSVIISGSLADLAPPKPLMVGAFLWEAVWNAVTAVAVTPDRTILFFVARAMQGLAVGVLVSSSMSILGRVYNPGIRKTRVFSMMAAGAPFGFWIGCVQGAALGAHLPWIFGSTAIFLGVCALAAYLTIPTLSPAKDNIHAEAPSMRQFDYPGAVLSSLGCSLILFGLTQGSSANWSPYTYVTIILGFALLLLFYYVEQRVPRPLIPNGLWKTPGFAALLVSYFLGLGGYCGAWQFYAIQFWQRYQGASPLTTALYILPNAIVGVLAAWIVSRTLHLVPGHWILTTSMVCFAMGSVFFLPQTPDSNYWALSMPGVALATFGPDLSFAAAAIFITSSVPRSYQGSAGSLLVTVQNLTIAVMTSISESIGTKIDPLPSGEIGLNGLRAIWWFGLGAALVGALITATMVRIPRAEEKEHVQ